MKSKQILLRRIRVNVVALLGIMAINSCNNPPISDNYVLETAEDAITLTARKEQSSLKSFNFTFQFSSTGGPVVGDNSCGAPPLFLVHQNGTGVGTHFGNLTFFAEFCSNFATGEFYATKDGSTIFTAVNGDQLFFGEEGKGNVLVPSELPGYELESISLAVPIVGGTGRFEGATGSARAETYVDTDEPRSDHRWSGTIYLPK